MSKLDYMLTETDSQISFFLRKRNENRSRVLVFGVASASLSALATVAIGAAELLSMKWLPLVALVATAAATVVAVWESVFAYRRLWAINNTVLAGLYKLKRTMDYKLASNGTQVPDDQVDELFQELDRLITEADAEWVKTYAVK